MPRAPAQKRESVTPGGLKSRLPPCRRAGTDSLAGPKAIVAEPEAFAMTQCLTSLALRDHASDRVPRFMVRQLPESGSDANRPGQDALEDISRLNDATGVASSRWRQPLQTLENVAEAR